MVLWIHTGQSFHFLDYDFGILLETILLENRKDDKESKI